jgi:hypothetical protein
MAGISQLQAVTLCQQVYAPIAAEAFDIVVSNENVTAGVKKFTDADGVVITSITFAGSENARDWYNDFDALKFSHPLLGIIHRGMWQGMDDIFIQLKPYLTGQLAISGHSLGCSHATMLAGLCAVFKLPVAQLALFAPPRCSYAALIDIVTAWVGSILAYRNGIDPVTTVPYTSINEDWVSISAYILLNEAPTGWLKWFKKFNPIEWHMIGLYMAGIRKLS